MLFKLLSTMDRRRFECAVISLTDRTELLREFESLGIPVNVVGSRAWYSFPWAFCRLIGQLRKFQPDLVQGWMYHGSFAATCASVFLPTKTPVIWNIRAATVSPQLQRFRTRALIWASRWIANRPAGILNNSRASATFHELEFGYPAQLTKIIPNGFDPTRFKSDDLNRKKIRVDLGVPQDAPLVGLVARLDPSKDHENFLRTADALSKEFPEMYFVLIGTEITKENLAAIFKCGPHMPEGHLIVRPPRADIEVIHQALDIEVLSSRSEGFPNSIGEAMACGVPCVVTDVGDCALLVGDTGRVVAKENPVALAGAIRELVQLSPTDRRQLGQRARQRIIDHFSMEAVCRSYEDYFEQFVNRGGRSSCAE